MPTTVPRRSNRPAALTAGVATTALTASLLLMPAVTTATGGALAAEATTSRVLSSSTVNPSGGEVRSTFSASRIDAARDGWQGTSASLPSNPTDRPGATDVAGPLEMDDDRVSTEATRQIPYQRFDLPSRGAGQTLLWSGRVDTARTVVLSAWDGSRWEELTRARGLGSDDLTLEVASADRHQHGGVVPVLVHAEDPFADDIDHEVRDGLEDPADYDFAIAHHSDTQFVVRGAISKSTDAERGLWRRGYTDATDWLARNAEHRKIVMAAHTGDLIDQWLNAEDLSDPGTARAEFEVASQAQRTLENAGIVTTTLPGNHDNVTGTDNGPTALYNEYFGPSRYDALNSSPGYARANASYAPWRAGDASNSVTTFSAGGLDFVAVSLGFGVTAEEAAWASATFASHPDRNGILLTHSFTSPSVSPDGRGGGVSAEGQLLRDQVMRPNPNVALVLSGHETGVGIGVRRDLAGPGNHVVELLSDYQHYTFTAAELGIDGLGGYAPDSAHRLGASFLRLLQVDVDRSEISVDTFSPYRNVFGATGQDHRNRYDGREDDFRIPVKFTSRTTSFSTDALLSMAPGGDEIGTVTTASGAAAQVTWDTLVPGRTYGWRVEARDASSGTLIHSGAATWFKARRDADSVPPRLVIPRSTSVAHASEFDPRRGVSARDDDGTNLTGAVVVTGRVDTARPGVHALTYSVRDAAGNSSVAARGITVGRAPGPVQVAAPVISGTGQVGTRVSSSRGEWRNIENADVRIQWLRNGTAIPGATGTDFQVRTQDIGTLLRARVEVRAAGRQAVTVNTEAVRGAKLAPSRTSSLVKKATTAQRPIVKARYTNPWALVTGTVEVRVGKKRLARGSVKADGSVSIKLPKLKAGKNRTLTVAYLGTSQFSPVNSTHKITVTKAKKPKKAKKAKKKATAKKKTVAKKTTKKKATPKKKAASKTS